MTTPAEFAQAAQDLAAALLAAAVDPADGIRLLAELAALPAPAATEGDPIGAAQADLDSATADLFRRAAVVAVARAAADYQPSSYDDAAAVRDRVTALLDAEIVAAGDAGEDPVYETLRTLRVAVVEDLTARGASLARIAVFAPPAPLPALALAQRLYRDPARADELVIQADPIHPAFMPVSFRALAR